MQTNIWRQLWIGGMILALLRAGVECFRLMEQYPVLVKAPIFVVQVMVLYSVAIGVTGGILARCLWYCLKRRETVLPWLPLVWFVLLAGFDALGFSANLPRACRVSQSLPPRHHLPETAPDVLLISLDTCRSDALGAYGNPHINTPVLDRLSVMGALAENAVTSIPVTTPAHATLLTGFEPPVHGSRFNAVPLSPAIRTLPEILRDYGYATGGFVSAFPVTHEVSGLGRGFDVYDQLLTPDRLHPLIYRTGILAGFTRFHVLRPAERKWFRTVPSVLQWWSRTPAKPRFTWVHFYDPHFPYEPQPEFRKMTWPETPRFDQSVFEIAMMNAQGIHPETSRIEEYKALYHGEVAGVDAAVGHLVRALQQSDRFQDTLIIVAADHGESLDEHDYYFAHGENLYDPSLNVPLLASFPRVIQSRLILPGQTSLNTVPGIIQSVLGIPLSDHDAEYCRTVAIQHEMLRGESPLKALGIKSFCETGAGVYTTAHEPSDDRIRMKKRGIRTHGAKLILDEDGTVSGYDLETDPGETRPGAPEGNNEFMELYGELTEYIRAADPPDRQPVNLPDAEAIRQLRALGYIDE